MPDRGTLMAVWKCRPGILCQVETPATRESIHRACKPAFMPDRGTGILLLRHRPSANPVMLDGLRHYCSEPGKPLKPACRPGIYAGLRRPSAPWNDKKL